MAARRTTRSRGFRPQTSWAAVTPSTEMTVPAATKLLFGSFTTGQPSTVRRTFGILNWRSDQTVNDERPMGAFGMCVVSNEAFAAGVASMPGPFTDADSDLWFVHQFMFAAFEQAGTVDGFETAAGQQYIINSKAMRKVTDDERVVMVMENGHASQGAVSYVAVRLLASPAAR